MESFEMQNIFTDLYETVTEYYEVIGNMKLNKPPGLDGLTIELYRAFWGK